VFRVVTFRSTFKETLEAGREFYVASISFRLEAVLQISTVLIFLRYLRRIFASFFDEICIYSGIPPHEL
jgi:hypothetical protein